DVRSSRLRSQSFGDLVSQPSTGCLFIVFVQFFSAAMPEHQNTRSTALQYRGKLLCLIAWNDWVPHAACEEHRKPAEISHKIRRERNLRSEERRGRQVMRMEKYQTGCGVCTV